MIGITAPENNVARPIILYPAAITDIDIAEANVSNVNIIACISLF